MSLSRSFVRTHTSGPPLEQTLERMLRDCIESMKRF